MHMCNEKSKFEALSEEAKSKEVYTAKKKSINVLGKENIRIKVQSQNKFGNNLKLKEVI